MPELAGTCLRPLPLPLFSFHFLLSCRPGFRCKVPRWVRIVLIWRRLIAPQRIRYPCAYDELHQLRRRRDFGGGDSKAGLMTRLAAMDAPGRKRARDSPDELPDGDRQPNRVGERHLASTPDKEVVAGPAQWRNPGLKVKWGRYEMLAPVRSGGGKGSAGG